MLLIEDDLKYFNKQYKYAIQNKCFIACYRIDWVNAYDKDFAEFSNMVQEFSKSANEDLILKFVYKSSLSDETIDGINRSSSISELNYRAVDTYLIIEYKPKVSFLVTNIEAKSEIFIKYLKELNSSALKSCSVVLENIDLFICPIYTAEGFDFNLDDSFILDKKRAEYISVLKLNKLSKYDINPGVLSELLCHMPYNLEVVTGIKKKDQTFAKIDLKRKVERSKKETSDSAQIKNNENRNALVNLELGNAQSYELEMSIILRGPSIEGLMVDSKDILSSLNVLGEFYLERDHSVDSYLSTRPGYGLHITNIEYGNVMPSYIPIYLFSSKIDSLKGMPFYTKDNGLYAFNLHSDIADNANAVLIGTAGRGKSVLANSVIKCLADSPKNKLIIIDLKSSHARTVKDLGGEIHNIGSDSIASINPFTFLKVDQSSEMIQIVSNFVKVLLAGNGKLSEVDESFVENSVHESVKNKLFDFNDFVLNFFKNHSKFQNIKRWIKGGLLENVLSSDEKNTFSKVTYFDCQSLSSATNAYFMNAIISSIMCAFFKAVRDKKPDERLYIICDETPAFIKSNFNSFQTLSKNIRKLGAGLILIAQNLSDLINQGNDSLISQSSHRIVFTCDGGISDFKETTELSTKSIDFLTSKNIKPKGCFVYKGPDTERILFHRITTSEYFDATTDPNDLEKLSAVSELLNINSFQSAKVMSYAKNI